MPAKFIIQLGLLSREDDRYWWSDSLLWDDGYVSTVYRPTEDEAFRQIYRQSKIIQRHGANLYLGEWHILALKLEFICKRDHPYYRNPHEWIAERMGGIPQKHVKGMLEQSSATFALREALGLPPPQIDWQLEPHYTVRKGRAA